MPAGLTSFEAEGWGGHVYLTPTGGSGLHSPGTQAHAAAGTKFVALHSLNQQGLDETLRRVYEICAFARAGWFSEGVC